MLHIATAAIAAVDFSSFACYCGKPVLLPLLLLLLPLLPPLLLLLLLLLSLLL
jgi:hypothetical protein